MNVTGGELFAKCKSFKDGERCRFFRGWEPLKPGFNPNPQDAGILPGQDAEELFPPDRLKNLRRGAHYVYRVEGEDVDEFECVCVGVFEVGPKGKETPVPYAWFSQSDDFIQGADAIERIGITVEDDLLHNYAPALNAIDEGIQAYVEHWPNHRMVLAFDDGTGLRCVGNDSPLMDTIYEADKASDLN